MSDKGTYLFHNPETDEAYVGSSSGMLRRRREHLRSLESGTHRNRRFQAAYDRNPNFDFVAVPLDSRDEAFDLEQTVIDEFRSFPRLLNISHDARYCNAGRPLSTEHKAKLSAVRKGRPIHSDVRTAQLAAVTGKPLSEDHKRKVSLGLTGREVSQETRQKLSIANSGAVMTGEQRRKLSASLKESERAKAARETLRISNTGRALTDEHKEKISKANTGKALSQERRDRLREIHLGRSHSDETKRQMSQSALARGFSQAQIDGMKKANSVPVIVEGVEYESFSDAARALGTDSKTVSRRVRDTTGRFNNWGFKNGH